MKLRIARGYSFDNPFSATELRVKIGQSSQKNGVIGSHFITKEIHLTYFFLWGIGMMQISLVCYIRNINIHYCGGLLFNNSFCFEGKNNQERSCNYIVLGSARSGSELVWEIRVTPRTHTPLFQNKYQNDCLIHIN